MAKKDPGAGPYSRDYAPLTPARGVDSAGNSTDGGPGVRGSDYSRELQIDNLHTDRGSAPLPTKKR